MSQLGPSLQPGDAHCLVHDAHLRLHSYHLLPRPLTLRTHSQAKALLIQKIDSFIRDRILLAGKVIEQHALAKIQDGDVILTYARSSLVEGVLLEAKRAGKIFSVVVVDSRPLYEGSSYPSAPTTPSRSDADRLDPTRPEPARLPESSFNPNDLRAPLCHLGRPPPNLALPARHRSAHVERRHVRARRHSHGRAPHARKGCPGRVLLRDVQVFGADHARLDRGQPDGCAISSPSQISGGQELISKRWINSRINLAPRRRRHRPLGTCAEPLAPRASIRRRKTRGRHGRHHRSRPNPSVRAPFIPAHSRVPPDTPTCEQTECAGTTARLQATRAGRLNRME